MLDVLSLHHYNGLDSIIFGVSMAGKKLSDEYLWERAKKRFVSRYLISDSGCWEWQAGQKKESHRPPRGQFCMPRNGKKPELAHRCSWQFFVGAIPDGAHVLHKCDNPNCVNPDHLYLGDHKQNMKDKGDRSRRWIDRDESACKRHLKKISSHPAEKNPAAKLDWDKVNYIRSSEKTNKELSEELNVHVTTIWLVRTHKTWIKT